MTDEDNKMANLILANLANGKYPPHITPLMRAYYEDLMSGEISTTTINDSTVRRKQ